MTTMHSFGRASGWFVCAFFCFVSLCSASDLGTVVGVVRDSDGKPLNGVRVTLRGQAPPSTFETATDSSGAYLFTGLSAGAYSIAVDLSGYVANAPASTRVTADAPSAEVDLALLRAPRQAAQTAAPINAQPAQTTAQPPPKLEFQSSGIRGLIDPGGYSASSAGAASGVLRGIADVKRTGKGSAAFAAKNWPCGLGPELRRAVDSNPTSAAANLRLGQFYTAHDEPAKAIPLLKQVLASEPHDPVGLHELATAWLESGNFDHARALLLPLAEGPAGPTPDPELHQLLARADEGLGQFKEASQQYRIATAEDPTEESLFGIGYESVLAGSLPQALDAFSNGVQRYPRSVLLRIGLGATQFLQARTADAMHTFLDATEIDPADPRPYSFLAGILGLTEDRNDQATLSFKRYLALRPDSASANYFYAQALSFDTPAPDPIRIEGLLRRAIQLDPNLAKAHLLLADTLAQQQDYVDAVPEYEASIRLDSALTSAHYRLALAYQRTGKPDLSAREMQIFRLSKQPKPSANDGIDLAQFVSVLAEPDQHSSQELQCPADSR